MRKLLFTLLAPALLAWLALHRAAADEPLTDLFEAMEAGQVTVKFIPANAAKANVLIENVTDRVLHLKLPDAIAAVPVLAQFDQGFGQNPGGGGGGASNQGVGGGINAGGNGMQGMGQPFGGGNQFGAGNNRGGQGNQFVGGFMRIEPEKVRKVTARTVCLEYGKPDPHPRIAYRMIAIDEFTDDPKVAELCRQLGRGEVAQKTAQAAAWHLANGLSWEKIASVNRIESRYLGNIKLFTPKDLERAKKFVLSLTRPSSLDEYVDDYAAAR